MIGQNDYLLKKRMDRKSIKIKLKNSRKEKGNENK
jgi:hypothetical protein